MDYKIIYDELNTDPFNYGYLPLRTAGDWPALAALFNTKQDGLDGKRAITKRRSAIRSNEVLEAIDTRDLDPTATAEQNAWFTAVMSMPTLRLVNDDGSNTRILGGIRCSLLGADTYGSRVRLDAIANEFISRAAELGQIGVQSSDVAEAFRLAAENGW